MSTSTESVEEAIRRRLERQGQSIDQEDLVESLADRFETDEDDILFAMKGMMNRGDLYYSPTWELELEK